MGSRTEAKGARLRWKPDAQLHRRAAAPELLGCGSHESCDARRAIEVALRLAVGAAEAEAEHRQI